MKKGNPAGAVQPEGGSSVQFTSTSELKPDVGLLLPVQEVMSPKHGGCPEERGQREIRGGAVFSFTSF